MTKGYKAIDIKLIILIILSVPLVGIIILASIDNKPSYEAAGSAHTPMHTMPQAQTPEPVPAPEQNSYTIGDTFILNEYYGATQITLGNYSFATIHNEFSDDNGRTVVKIPVTEVNKGNKAGSLSMFGNSIYKPDGTETKWSVGAYFDDSMLNAGGYLQPNATQTTYLYFLYGGNGEYIIDFNRGETIVKFNVTK